MSGYKEHLKFGLCSIIVLSVILIILYYFNIGDALTGDLFNLYELWGIGIPLILIAFSLGLYASLLPDIDVGTSKVFHFTIVVLLALCIIFIIYGIYKYQTVAILVLIISMMFLNHRGMTHSIWFGLIISVVFGYAFGSILVFLYSIVGYYSHLFKD